MENKGKKLSVFQLLKSGTSFSSKQDREVSNKFKTNEQIIQEEQIQKRKRKGSSVDLSHMKFNASDSESEGEDYEVSNVSRRKKSLDEIELTLQKKHNQKINKINLLKKQLKIKVEGDQIPDPISNFTKLIKKYKVDQNLVNNIRDSGYTKPTPIQVQGIPIVLEKRNLLALAPTGSGKTLTFALPIIHSLGQHKKDGLRSIVFAPTVDLGEQIEREMSFLNRNNSLKIKFIHNIDQRLKAFVEQIQNIDILICTPLKFLKIFKFIQQIKEEKEQKEKEIKELQEKLEKVDKLTKKAKKDQNEEKLAKFQRIKVKSTKVIEEIQEKLNSQEFLHSNDKIILENLEYLVFDEADKYFELNLAYQMKQILELFQNANENINYMLFSATISFQVEELVRNLINDPIKLQISGKNNVLNTIDQSLSYCQSEYGKLVELKNIINEGRFTPPVLIFVQSKERGKELLSEMNLSFENIKIKVDFIHQDKTQEERQQIINDFRTGKLYALICTDLMARGIDFKGVNLVINYDFPQTMITYVHRVGRTGRANRKGTAITFFTDQDKPILKDIGNLLKTSGCDVPDWILSLKKMSKKDRKHMEKFPVKRDHIARDPELHTEKDKEYDYIMKKAQSYYKNTHKSMRRQERKSKQQEGGDNEEGEWKVVPGERNKEDEQWNVVGQDDDGFNVVGDDQ